MMDEIQFNALSRKIGYKFKDKSLLMRALTHRSAGSDHNERLEYLGDSILGFIIAKALYLKFPEQPEGKLTRMRSTLVKGETLAKMARTMELGDVLQLGPGELKSGGFARDSILADAVEAIIGALYLETSMEESEKLVLQWFKEKIDKLDPDFHPKDAKTRLQEHLQGKHLPLPEYEVKKIKGKSHNQQFYVTCKVSLLNGLIEGEGASRRKAEQAAAINVLRKLSLD
ncbi:MAG: ribonuclease III [Aestuariibacter sp.]